MEMNLFIVPYVIPNAYESFKKQCRTDRKENSYLKGEISMEMFTWYVNEFVSILFTSMYEYR